MEMLSGIWENNIKSAILYLSSVVIYQILIQIEYLLNSRMLCIKSNNPKNPTDLTHSNFLCNKPLSSLLVHDVKLENINVLHR